MDSSVIDDLQNVTGVDRSIVMHGIKLAHQRLRRSKKLAGDLGLYQRDKYTRRIGRERGRVIRCLEEVECADAEIKLEVTCMIIFMSKDSLDRGVQFTIQWRSSNARRIKALIYTVHPDVGEDVVTVLRKLVKLLNSKSNLLFSSHVYKRKMKVAAADPSNPLTSFTDKETTEAENAAKAILEANEKKRKRDDEDSDESGDDSDAANDSDEDEDEDKDEDMIN